MAEQSEKAPATGLPQNITENELRQKELKKELAEKNILLSLSRNISRIRAKQDLAKLIKEQFSELFYFYHCTICIVCEDGISSRAFLLDPNSKIKIHSKYKHLISSTYPLANGIDDVVVGSEYPVIFDFDMLAQEGKLPPQGEIIHEAGIKEMVGARLVREKQVFGWIVFYSDIRNNFSKQHLSLIDGIATMIAPAVANIIANEEIENKIKEREALLSVSDAIANVKDRAGLQEIINNTLKNLFSFTHSIALRLSQDGSYLTKFMLDPNSKSKDYPTYTQIVGNKITVNDGILNIILSSKEPVVVDLEKSMAMETRPAWLEMNYATGLRQMAVIVLRTAEQKPLGTIAFYAEKKNNFSSNNLRLLQGISYHLSTAMENILYHEDIIRRDRENELLLAVSYSISSLKNKYDLLNVIGSGLKAELKYSDIAICLYNSKKETYRIFLHDCPTLHTKEDYEKIIDADYLMNEGISNVVVLSDKAVIFSYEHLQRFDYPYASFMLQAGIKELACIRLVSGSEIIGGLILMSATQNTFLQQDMNLLERVSHHVATAVSDILSVEEIKNREIEKSLLLSFSNDIASVRDKKGLRFVIKKYLKDIFRIKEYIITIKNEDAESYAYFLHDLSSPEPTDRGFEIITGPKMPVKGSFTGAVLASEEPVTFNIAAVLKEKNYSFPSESFWKAANAENIMGIRLKVGNETAGILWVQPGQINDSLIKGITAQIAIAIANIVANEKIEAQLSEINNYKQQLVDEKLYLQEEAAAGLTYSDIIGTGPEMQKVFLSLSQVSFVNSTVLILGETGTGKELVARAIHNGSPRKDKLMVKVNCAALPPNLIESELFGHERGSFTGATERRIGKFELANNGTLFLDEIGEMPLELQVKLLRAIQEKEIERVGGKTTIKTDVRLIAATNRNLQKEVDEGRFRRDLYYRLNVFPLSLPPLRDRKDDIPLLAAHFIEKYAKNAGKKISNISGKAMKQLVAYSWPGNVRELEHLLERSVLITQGEVIREMHLPVDNSDEIKTTLEDDYVKTFEENERDHIMDVLNKCNGKIFGAGGAAEILKLNVGTLNSKIKKLGIVKGKTFYRKDPS